MAEPLPNGMFARSHSCMRVGKPLSCSSVQPLMFLLALLRVDAMAEGLACFEVSLTPTTQVALRWQEYRSKLLAGAT